MSELGAHQLVKDKCYKTNYDGYLGKYRGSEIVKTVQSGMQEYSSEVKHTFDKMTKIIYDYDTRGRFIEVPCESSSSSSSSAAASSESRISFLEKQLAAIQEELRIEKEKTKHRVARRRKTRSRRYV